MNNAHISLNGGQFWEKSPSFGGNEKYHIFDKMTKSAHKEIPKLRDFFMGLHIIDIHLTSMHEAFQSLTALSGWKVSCKSPS